MMNAPCKEELSNRFSAEDWTGRKPAYASGGPITIPADAPATLTEALLRRATETDRGVIYIQKDGQEDFQSYAELLSEARCILTGLRKLGLQPRDRVILQIDSLRNHFTTFWACVLGGFTPVTVAVAPSYKEKNGVVSKLWNTWKLLRSPLVITSAHLEPAIQGLTSFLEMPDLRTTAVEPLKEHPPAADIFPAKPEDLVFFQLTSGSTGVPKCIQETHRGIIYHIHGSQQFNCYKRENISLNWLPVDHVVPILTSHLKDVYLGIQQIHVKSEIILSNPLRWLDLMHQHRVTHTWCPNFGFKLVSDRLAQIPPGTRSWELGCIEFMMNAGEQVTLPVVSDFLTRTAPFGIRPGAMQPAFGMAEVCTCMTYQNNFSLADGVHRFKKSSLGSILQIAAANDPAAVTFVDLGPPVPGVEIRITDKENKVVPEGVIGRFQIRGAVVTPGYLYNDAANQEAFVGSGWFNSGDLGFILNGRLTLTGREKEMIIVRGANFYCYEIEDVVNSIEGVEPTFVSSSAVPDASTGTEGLAIMFVPKPEHGFDPDGSPTGWLVALAREIKTRVAASLGINPAFVIPLERNAFLKTTSGKIQRSQMKKNFEAGEYDRILEQLKAAATQPGSDMPRNPVEEKLLSIWRDLLKAPALGINDNFFAAGGDSLLAAQVIARVQDNFKVELPLHSLFERASTIEGMAEQIRTSESKKQSAPPIRPRNDAAWAPASLGQQRLWLLDQINPGSPAYNVGVIVRLKGPLDPSALQASFAALMERHESLRARFEVARGQVCQIFDVRPISVAHDQAVTSDFDTIYRAAYKEAAKPFDLRAGPLLRAKLLRTEAAEQYLLLTIHQTIIDGWSLKLLFQELAEHYQGQTSGRPASIPPLQIRYGDYAAWQREWLQGEVLDGQMNFWRKELAGDLPEINLPIDLPRPQIQTFLGDTQVHHLTADLSDALRQFAKEQGTTVFMALIAAYQMCLNRISGQDQVVIGTAIAGRGKTELEAIIGFFVNTVALRASFASNPSFSTLLSQIREKTLAAYEYQHAPFEKIVEEVQPARTSKRSPIFQTWFGAWDALPEQRAGELTIEPVRVFMPGAQFELSLFAIDRKEIELIWEYRTDLFLSATISRLRAQFENLLRRALRSPNTPLQTIFAALNDEEYQDRLREQSRSRDGLRLVRRKRLQPASADQNPI
jgi:acyl-CoA synthetase (AMP-forming)/AMP-acid ligase II